MIFLVVPSSLYAIPYKLGIKKKKGNFYWNYIIMY